MRIKTSERAFAGNRLRRGGEGWQLRSDSVLRSASFSPGRKTAQGNLSAEHALITREPFQFSSCVHPWCTQSAHLVTFHSALIRPCPQDATKPVKKRAALDTLGQLGEFDWEVWSDGTLQEDPGTGMQVGIGGGQFYASGEGRRRFQTCAAAGFFPSSYRAEGVGILTSLQFLINSVPSASLRGMSVLLCTDSLSQVEALSQGPLLQTTVHNGAIWVSLLQLLDMKGVTKIVFQWVPAHCGLRRNEAVDQYVGRAAATVSAAQAQAPIPLAAVKATLKSTLRNAWRADLSSHPPLSTHPFPIKPDIRVISGMARADSTLLLQVRSGACSEMGQLYHILRGDKGGLCRWCGGSEETVLHVFSKCRAVKNLRREENVKDVKQLGSSDETLLNACVKFARRALASLG